MATTIKIEAKPVTATVDQQEVVAQPTITNYVTTDNVTPTITTGNIADPSLSITSSGLDEKAVPTTIRSRSEIDLININESVLRVLTYRRTFTDPLAITDAFSRVVTYRRTIQDSARISQETIAREIRSLKTDRVNAGENITKSIRPVRTDLINVSESIRKSFATITIDSGNILENIRLTPRLLKTDSITTADSFVRFLSWYRTFTETLSITDDYLGNANIDDDQYATFIKGILISVQISEFTSKQISAIRTDDLNSIGDIRFIKVNIPKTDNFTTTDTFSRIVAYKRTQSEQINFAETLLKTVGKLSTDNVNITELKFSNIQMSKFHYVSYLLETVTKSINPNYSDSTNILEYIAKNISAKLPDQVVQVLDTTFKLSSLLKSDNLLVADQFNRLVNYNRILTDQITATDDYLGAANIDDDQYVVFGKGTLDIINLVEYIAKNINKPLATEVVNVLDTKYINISLPKTDSGTVNDQSTRLIQINPSRLINLTDINYKNINSFTADTINYNDSVQKQLNPIVADVSQITDNLTRVVNYLRLLTDQINTTDDYLGTANIDDDQYAIFGKGIIDTVNFSENLQKSISNVTIDQINLIEAVLINKYSNFNKVDLINITDSFLKNITIPRIELINITDIFSRAVNYVRTLEESSLFDFLLLENSTDFLLLETGDFLVTDPYPPDYIVLENLTDYLLLETGDFLVTDAYRLYPPISLRDSARVDSSILKTDILNVLDTPLKRVTKPFVDSANSTDSFSKVVNYLRTLTDQINVTHDYLGNANIDDDQYTTFSKRIIDQVNFTENIYKYASKPLQDITNTNDQQYLNPRTTRTDQANFTDILTTFKFANRTPTDAINVSNPGTAYLQDYFEDPLYVELGYVGTIITFT